MALVGPAAVVTGAASGLGRAVVGWLRAAGWRTAGIDLSPAAGADFDAVADITDGDALAGAVAAAVEHLGGLDGAAACAGVNATSFALGHRLPRADWDRLLSVNLTGAFLTAQAVLPHLVSRRGALVIVSSVSAHHPLPGAGHYSAAKAGVVALTRSLALEYAARNARRYGAIAGLSAGLIGPPETPRAYPGSFAGTPVFLGCSDVDWHIPLARVHESRDVLGKMGAAVTERIYPGMGHTVNQDEIAHVRNLVGGIAAGIP